MLEAAQQKKKSRTGRLNKPKLDNARKLTGKHIDLHDMEFMDIMKSARKELEVAGLVRLRTLGTERPLCAKTSDTQRSKIRMYR